jgi:hypothetical protein
MGKPVKIQGKNRDGFTYTSWFQLTGIQLSWLDKLTTRQS